MSPIGILVASAAIDAANVERIRGFDPDANVTVRPCSSGADVSAALDPKHEVLFTQYLPDSVERSARLKWVQLLSAGVDHVSDSPTWDTSSFVVTTTSGIHAPAISEYVIGTILHWTQRLSLADRFRSTRRWDERPASQSLAGKTLGILGYGSLGRRIATIATTLGLRVIAVRREPDQAPSPRYRWPFAEALDGKGDATEIVALDQLRRVLRESDFLALTIPLTEQTEGLIGAAELALMRPTSVIVNVSRGRLVDEGALASALREGRIAFAALDVFATEPLPHDSPLFELPNVLLTPHVSGHFAGYVDRATDVFLLNLAHYRSGATLINLADRRRGY
jgi:phosphoglycerate dehydrogenase-like enzyme